ncbi:MAG: phosphate/phosphite/phosphonate ABC transporter substrate-binding protein [Bdellovibrionales bacterium CG10_big_fil_rev_8_21_14_0_10_45_34]|nr:MAG: phosphate/phosphite/phosphonate ABC transporter substrate-binding protein [Bdellovibrionales bacterium CG10_big_fil_rev_8_21_14_0_10_45_34]
MGRTIQLRLCFFAALVSLFSACTTEKAELGTADNPIKFFFVPSVDAMTLEDTGRIVQAYLEENTPYKYKVSIPASYVAVVEAFGTERADVASLNTFGYVLAHEKYKAQARLTVIRFGEDTYKAQIVALKDGPIKKLEDVDGKKFAYVDPASTSGYLMPAKLFMDKGIKPADYMFAKKHDNVITMIYQKQVDAGATFYSPPEDGKIQDARRLVKTQFPDVEDKVKIVALTDAIPNDPIVFREGMPEEMKQTIVDALLKFVKTEQGKDALYKLYGVTDFKVCTDEKYDGVREMLKALGKSAHELVEKK